MLNIGEREGSGCGCGCGYGCCIGSSFGEEDVVGHGPRMASLVAVIAPITIVLFTCPRFGKGLVLTM